MTLAAASNASSSTVYSTPEMSQYIYNLPPDDNGDLEALSTLDYLVVALFCVLLVWGLVYAVRKFFGKVGLHCDLVMFSLIFFHCRRIADACRSRASAWRPAR